MKKVTLSFIVEDKYADVFQEKCVDTDTDNNLVDNIPFAANFLDENCNSFKCTIKDYIPTYEGKIEVLYATDVDDNTKTMVLAMPYHSNISTAFAKRNLESFFGTKDIEDEIIQKVCGGEEFESSGYTFGWETVEFEG